MKTEIQFIHIQADKKLQEYIEGKVDKLYKIYNRIESCNVALRETKNDLKKNKVVEINLEVPGNRLFATDEAETFYIAFDLAIDEIKKQLIKSKERISEIDKQAIQNALQ